MQSTYCEAERLDTPRPSRLLRIPDLYLKEKLGEGGDAPDERAIIRV